MTYLKLKLALNKEISIFAYLLWLNGIVLNEYFLSYDS